MAGHGQREQHQENLQNECVIIRMQREEGCMSFSHFNVHDGDSEIGMMGLWSRDGDLIPPPASRSNFHPLSLVHPRPIVHVQSRSMQSHALKRSFSLRERGKLQAAADGWTVDGRRKSHSLTVKMEKCGLDPILPPCCAIKIPIIRLSLIRMTKQGAKGKENCLHSHQAHE